jgi:hypothetical protein
MPDLSVLALDIGVLLWLAGLDVLDGNPMFLSPFHQLITDLFGAVVDPYGARLAAPLDNPIKAADDTFGGQREIDLDAQAFAVEVVENIQQSKSTAIAKPISPEIHRPGHIWRVRDCQRIRFVPLQPLAGLDCQVRMHPLQPTVLIFHGLCRRKA